MRNKIEVAYSAEDVVSIEWIASSTA